MLANTEHTGFCSWSSDHIFFTETSFQSSQRKKKVCSCLRGREGSPFLSALVVVYSQASLYEQAFLKNKNKGLSLKEIGLVNQLTALSSSVAFQGLEWSVMSKMVMKEWIVGNFGESL